LLGDSKGVVIIKSTSVELEKMFEDTIIGLTEQVAGITLKSKEKIPVAARKSLNRQKKVIIKEHIDFSTQCVTVIKTKGVFHSFILCWMDQDLFDALTTGMNRNRKLEYGKQVFYMMEYYNIICGRVLSKINNMMASTSRLTVPQVIHSQKELEIPQDDYRQHVRWDFDSDYGGLHVETYYDLRKNKNK